MQYRRRGDAGLRLHPVHGDPACVSFKSGPASRIQLERRARAVPRSRAGLADRKLNQQPRFATAKALLSNVSSAIFWASMQSPAAKFPTGTKHHAQTLLPAESSWSMFII